MVGWSWTGEDEDLSSLAWSQGGWLVVIIDIG